MVNSIGSGLPPSVQAVNKARDNAQQVKDNSQSNSVSDEVSISSEAQELSEINRLASDTREILQSNDRESLTGNKSFDALL